jgi:predicted nucleotidyltransferase
MKQELLNLIQEKSPGAKPLLLVIRGSHAYGTNIETSDTDFSGVFIQSMEDILGFNYVEQINDDKNDIVIYEIRRFLQLLESNNPTVLELLNTPEDCIVYKDPIFDEILNNKDKFITKICAKSFGGYAVQQIQKAKGQNKKQNWERDRVTRKDVLDFVYVIEGEKSIPWKVWNETKGYEEKFCGVCNVPNARDVYAVYYDDEARSLFSTKLTSRMRSYMFESRLYKDENGELKSKPLALGYKGLIKVGEGDNLSESNQLRLSSIPKGETPICNIIYNKDGYSQHCREYKEYEEWLENRNTQRWVDVESHGQKIDGKNMMHCKRLTQMSREIAEGLGIIVRRPDAEELLNIRRGKVDLQTLIDDVENEIKEIDELFKNSTLPDKVDKTFVNELLVKIRKNIYNI